jgi:hypothetical protein
VKRDLNFEALVVEYSGYKKEGKHSQKSMSIPCY